MDDGFTEIATLQDLWEWCRLNRKGAWKFPEKWGVRGYAGNARICIVADVPAPRWLAHLHGSNLTVPTEESCADVFNTPQDFRFYELLKKYGLQEAHLMDTHISETTDLEQDRRVFLKQMDIVNPVALLVMDMDKRGRGPLATIKTYLGDRELPKIYRIYHYRWVLGTKYAWEEHFKSVLSQVTHDLEEAAAAIRL